MSKYNGNVRIGNWFYDLILQEEKTKQYIKKSKNSELKVQNTRFLFLNLLKEVPLTFPVVGLSYGAVIQIVSPEMPSKTYFKVKEKQGISLAADINFEKVDVRREFDHGDQVIGSGLLTPCVRNVWTLVPEEKNRKGTGLRFGDTFYIRLYSSKLPLYIECPLPAPTTPMGESGHVTPKLTAVVSALARFKVVDINPKLRYETEGSPVPPFEKVAIIQASNCQSLGVETDTWFPTFFGMECEVSVNTFKSEKKSNIVDPRNFWSFILSSA